MWEIKRLIFFFLISNHIFIKIDDLKLINSNICIFDIIEIIKSNKCLTYNNDLFNQKPINNLYINKTLNIFWWKGKGISNVGDYYGKWLLEKMGFKVKYSKHPELVVCGSILGYKQTNFINTKVWGAGYHFKKQKNPKKDKRIFYAVRGKLTYNKLKLESNIALGDPGLLLSKVFVPKSTKKYKLCIISHYVDYSWFKNNYNDKYYIINMGVSEVEKVINKINKCHFVFSSSLHGIIFSHSLGIPAIHIIKKKLASKNNFKFKDYYSVLDIPYTNINLNKEKLEDIIEKYINNKNQYLPSKKRIKQIQDSLIFAFPYQKMENVICAIAKNENKYINDWCHYHINLGFDNIYIYDNNDNNTEYIGDFIDDEIKNKVHILDINNKKLQQQNSYNSFYILFNSNFKWCAYIDIDEFIILEKWNNISEFVNDKIFKDAVIIRLKWHIFGDDNLIQRPFIQPIYKEIKNRLIGHFYEKQAKSIIKGNLKHVKFKSVHYPLINSKVPSKQYLSNGIRKPGSKISINTKTKEPAYINHYITKTLSEFFEQKLNRGDAARNRRIKFNYFWLINKKTQKKKDFIKKQLSKEKGVDNSY